MKKQLFFIVLACVTTVHITNANIFKKLTQFNEENRQELTDIVNNFYTVEEGVFYRSQKLNEKDLEIYIKKFNIKTIINLRGDKGAPWWETEKTLAQRNGVLFLSMGISAVYLISKEKLIQILTLFQEVPRPILVHCIGGADRTGAIAALWVLDQQKKDKTEARKQLDLKYGHRKYKNSVHDFLIEVWQGREWAFKEYNPERDYPDLCRPQKKK